MEKQTAHSAEYFGDHRNFWWNQDFLDLMAKRWDLSTVFSVLDVGSGQGHSARALAKVLPADAHITCIDQEMQWIDSMQEDPNFPKGKYTAHLGKAESLPFPDAHFDMVTCQTVLLHVHDPFAVIKEMLRVLKPGGLIVTIEPNNCISEIVFDTLTIDEPVDDTERAITFYLKAAKGQQNLHLGCDKIGDVIPYYFAQLGLDSIQVYQSDKTNSLFPPYKSPDQQCFIQDLKDWHDDDLMIWGKEDTCRYYIAGGGSKEDFEEGWAFLRKRSKKRLEAIDNKTYATSGGCLFYIISARKPLIN